MDKECYGHDFSDGLELEKQLMRKLLLLIMRKAVSFVCFFEVYIINL